MRFHFGSPILEVYSNTKYNICKYVTVPPKISSFQSTVLQLNVGDRASLTCSVVKGDVPLTISWRKDGRAIELSSQHMSVKSVDQYNSILVIENLIADHTGNYSCCVRNLAAEVESAQSLLVNGNPCERRNRATYTVYRACESCVRIKYAKACVTDQTTRNFTVLIEHASHAAITTGTLSDSPQKCLVFRFSHICFFFLSLHSSSSYY